MRDLQHRQLNNKFYFMHDINMRNSYILIFLIIQCLRLSVIDCCNKKVKYELQEGFVYINDVNPKIIINLRYFGDINFVGSKIDGYYKNVGILSKPAADALSNAADMLDADGYSIVIYDAYRPQKAVDNFVRWANSSKYNQLMKLLFFPFVNHNETFDLGYIARRSGHSRGSTVDLTIINKNQTLTDISYISRTLQDGRIITFLNDNTIDMGSSFDLFDLASWSASNLVTQSAQQNRNYLINIMKKSGFNNYEQEWWHFTLQNEPYPNTYFNFNVE